MKIISYSIFQFPDVILQLIFSWISIKDILHFDSSVTSSRWRNSWKAFCHKLLNPKFIQSRIPLYSGKAICHAIVSNEKIAIGLANGTISLWDRKRNVMRHMLNVEGEKITCLLALPNARLFSGSALGKLRIWNVVTNHCELYCCLTRRSCFIKSAMLASPSKLLITTTADENILWDLHTNKIQALLTTILSSIRLSSQQLAVGTNEGEIQLWKFTEEDETNHSISFLNHTITKRIFLPSPFKVQNLLQLSDGRLLTHIAAEGKLYFWNLETRGVKEEITSIPVQCFSSITRIIEYQHPDSAFSLSSIISTPTTAKPEDYLPILFPNGNNIHIWTIAKSNCENPIQPSKKALLGHRLAVNQVVQLKSGRILSASWDQTIRIWNIFDGKTDCERIYSMDVLGDLSIDLLPDRKGFLVKSRSDIDIFRPFDDE